MGADRMLPKSRKFAKEIGATRYFTGKPCVKGHIAERCTANGNCLACVAINKKDYDQKYRAKNLEKIKEYDKNRLSRKRNPETLKAAKKRHYEKHKAIILVKMQKYRQENRERRQKYFQKYKKIHAGKVRFWGAKRDAAIVQRTPSWLTKSDWLNIRCKYEVAAMYTKEGICKWHVDHIIPIQGKLVSGLHVPSNLRVITESENVRKNNFWDVT